MLLTGSVVHEHVPWQQAAIHAGDWLVELLLVSVVTGRRGARSAVPVLRGRRRG